jgi:hypothetical protein
MQFTILAFELPKTPTPSRPLLRIVELMIVTLLSEPMIWIPSENPAVSEAPAIMLLAIVTFPLSTRIPREAARTVSPSMRQLLAFMLIVESAKPPLPSRMGDLPLAAFIAIVLP